MPTYDGILFLIAYVIIMLTISQSLLVLIFYSIMIIWNRINRSDPITLQDLKDAGVLWFPETLLSFFKAFRSLFKAKEQ